MAAVSETIVREFFELHGFFVRQLRKYVTPGGREDEEIDFLVLNPKAEPGQTAPAFVLDITELRRVARAVVVVKGWHTETFTPTRLAHTPELYRFLESATIEAAGQAFGTTSGLLKILVVPALPADRDARRQSIQVLKSKGVDGVIQFPTMLADLIDKVEINRNYQKSDLLQVIRILKNYDFFQDSQLELFRARPKRRRKRTRR